MDEKLSKVIERLDEILKENPNWTGILHSKTKGVVSRQLAALILLLIQEGVITVSEK